MNNGHTNVLLIEDNPGDADLVRLRLVEGDAAVYVNCVNRLADGLASMTKQPPSVVLLDLNLPDSHGAETFRKVLEHAPGVPVVILSGQDDEALAMKALHQGVQDYLVKGNITSNHLERAMRYAMERQALLRTLEMSRHQQLEFKNQFLSHVSHELRTPLTCIHQFVTILMDGLAGEINPEQRYHLETVLNSVHQLRAMIRDLLEATRAESGKIRIEARCITIADLIQQAVSMMAATAKEKQVGLEVGLDSRIPFVYADPDRVLQVLINLIDNGIKFTPAEGSVLVKACMVDADPNMVYLSVADSGRGIGPEARALIFERLYQDPNSVDNNRAGLGLGLHCEGTGGTARRTDLGGELSGEWQHILVYLAAVFAGEAAVSGGHPRGAAARCHRSGQGGVDAATRCLAIGLEGDLPAESGDAAAVCLSR